MPTAITHRQQFAPDLPVGLPAGAFWATCSDLGEGRSSGNSTRVPLLAVPAKRVHLRDMQQCEGHLRFRERKHVHGKIKRNIPNLYRFFKIVKTPLKFPHVILHDIFGCLVVGGG